MDNHRTFIVTWQTVVEMPIVNDDADIHWAVVEAEHKMRQLIADPTQGDNYFVVQEVTNRPAQKHFVALNEALATYAYAAAGLVEKEEESLPE